MCLFLFVFVFVFVLCLFLFLFLFTFVGFTNAYSLVKEKAIITLTVILCKKQREKGKVILTFVIIKIDFSHVNSILDFVPEPLPRFLSLVTEGWAGPCLETRLWH